MRYLLNMLKQRITFQTHCYFSHRSKNKSDVTSYYYSFTRVAPVQFVRIGTVTSFNLIINDEHVKLDVCVLYTPRTANRTRLLINHKTEVQRWTITIYYYYYILK